MNRRWLPVLLATLMPIPALLCRLVVDDVPPLIASVLFGAGIVGAAFLLSWGAEAAQKDISHALAIALVALIAVLPEYAVDMYFSWQAGQDPSSAYGSYATANMTGANRLLIGIGWPMVVFLYWLSSRRTMVELGDNRRRELSVLILATAYVFIIPIRGSIHLVDTVVLVGLFSVYIWGSARAGIEEPDLFGPAAQIGSFDPLRRRSIVGSIFLFSAGVIAVCVQPFAEGLIDTGRQFHLEEFLLVQWIAPLASESPELLIAALFALRGRGTTSMELLLSSKINQWTLLIGTIPLVYSFGLGEPGSLLLDGRQVGEIVLTASQSLFAICLVLSLVLTLRGSFVLAVLFVTQLIFVDPTVRSIYSVIYVVSAAGLVVFKPGNFKTFVQTVPEFVQGLKGTTPKN